MFALLHSRACLSVCLAARLIVSLCLCRKARTAFITAESYKGSDIHGKHKNNKAKLSGFEF